MSETLAHTTIVNYRARLKRLRLVLDKLSDEQRARAEVEIATLTLKLGPLAEPERKPGRPKTKAELPPPNEADIGKVAQAKNPYWSPEGIRLRQQSKLLLLKAKIAELEAAEGQAIEQDSEFEQADRAFREAAMREKEAEEGISGTEQTTRRAGEESERGDGKGGNE